MDRQMGEERNRERERERENGRNDEYVLLPSTPFTHLWPASEFL